MNKRSRADVIVVDDSDDEEAKLEPLQQRPRLVDTRFTQSVPIAHNPAAKKDDGDVIEAYEDDDDQFVTEGEGEDENEESWDSEDENEEGGQAGYEQDEDEHEDEDNDESNYCEDDDAYMPAEVYRPSGTVPSLNPGDITLAPGVYATEVPDNRHKVFGTPLRNVYKLLERLFHFQRLPGQLVWQSTLALTALEWAYIKDVLSSNRLQPTLQNGTRVLTPLPSGQLPGNLHPRDSTGARLKGPFITRNGLPHNKGRQFFSNFENGPHGCFMWADGVYREEAEAQESFNHWAHEEGDAFGMMFGVL
mmetsp:Transcript_26868/g.58630  ORF Transcript_26868/g.58630 Transcript_26868/m.58630 type:complete len:305 (+) Transcript_26868:157-1071(+)|eukprot:CAMPEP_0202895710 /NCGR_PEP_ID=MMETSP1392-20130828/4866_1 /ASSEMBLY_ACC=CAM_ASM_000868 /TAXON_ID=225041 /ORGANISM="Chlamydomonas chlamydogama, Strain SAG 11-48b" /LENGTH=304 /DNA_ID=CAMNT_0049580827 /DNA_START=125 /DNA_END=1039 /DNA_ORIENTATION=-